MRTCIIFGLLVFYQMNISARTNDKNMLTTKLLRWQSQQKKQLGDKLSNSISQEKYLKKKISNTQEKLSLLEGSNSSAKTKQALRKELDGYNNQLTGLEKKIKIQETDLKNINLEDYKKSLDYKNWTEKLNQLSYNDVLAVNNEITNAGEIQKSLKAVDDILANNNLDWDDISKKSDWSDLTEKLGNKKATELQGELTKINKLNDQVKNIELESLMEDKSKFILNDISDKKLNLPIENQKVKNITKNNFDLDKSLVELKERKIRKFEATKKKYKLKEIDHDNYKEVVFKKKPKLKDLMFVETDFQIQDIDKKIGKISSTVGFQVSDRFSFGLGAAYNRTAELNNNQSSFWSGKLLSRLVVYKDIVAIQYEGESTIPGISGPGDTTVGQWNFSNLIGTRVSMPSKTNIPLSMTLLHNLNKPNENSTTVNSPWLMKLGFSF